ncbi:MAG: hypothetical protein K2X98_04240 [Alphaproteobacteria bacterium]|nr:hypothetical protein [Alphaproteobacteria bacterium]
MTKNNKRFAAMSKALRENLHKRKEQIKSRKEEDQNVDKARKKDAFDTLSSNSLKEELPIS